MLGEAERCCLPRTMIVRFATRKCVKMRLRRTLLDLMEGDTSGRWKGLGERELKGKDRKGGSEKGERDENGGLSQWL